MHQRAHIGAPASVGALLATTALARLPIWNAPNDVVVAAHRDRQSQIMESSQAILNRAESETRDLTAEEQREVAGLNDEFDDLERQIDLRERTIANQARLEAPAGRRTDPDPAPGDELDELARAAEPRRTGSGRRPRAGRAASDQRHRPRHVGLPQLRRLRQLRARRMHAPGRA
ncbi:MAG: hypothetical protein WDM92_06450 [Caulobacteraceae bacterium]